MSRFSKDMISRFWPGVAVFAFVLLSGGSLRLLASHHYRGMSAPGGSASSSDPKAINQPDKDPALTIDTGNEYVINDTTIACVNDLTCKELDKIRLANDRKELKRFILYEKGFLLSGGDNVIVLGMSFWREEAKVRVLGGPHMGIVGWIPKKNLSAK